MARIGGYGRGVRLALVGLLFAFALALWFARPAAANCAVDPSDPMCTPSGGGGMSNPTSPPETNPPVNRTPETPPPVDRNPVTPAPNPGRAPVSTYTPPVPAGTDFLTQPVTPPEPPPETPSIALSGAAPSTGGGTAASSGPPPTDTSGDGLPWGPLALGGLGIAALLGLGAPAKPPAKAPPPPPPPPPPPTPPPPPVAAPAGADTGSSDWFVYKSGLDNHFSVAKLWEGGTMWLPGVEIVFGPATFAGCWAFVAASSIDSGPIFHAPGTPPLAGLPI